MNLNNLIQYCRLNKLEDPLNNIIVPSPLSSDLARSAIVIKCGLLTPVFGEPDVFAEVVKTWNASMGFAYDHLIKIYESDYDPVENYDRIEEWSDSGNRTRTKANSGNEKHSGADTETGTRENTISAENSNSYQPDNRSEDETITAYGQVIQRTDNGTETEENNAIRSGRTHGNIGVTTSAQMILGETDMLNRFDPYKWIAERFERDNMLMIY